jgi:hypothetical protein
MNIKSILMLSVVTSTALTLQGCGGGGPSSVGLPPAAPAQTLDTANVLSVTQSSTETDDPLAVNGGAVVVANASDETSDPVAVNAP